MKLVSIAGRSASLTSCNTPLRAAALAFACGAALTASNALACITVCVDFDRPCPPNGYNDEGDCTNHQPPFDCDTDGDGTDDAWCSPITLPNPGGGPNFPTTDSCGNMLSLPCIPDPAGPGKGGDHYRPTWKKPGERGPGTELGRCLYPCGRNTWKVGMCDTNGDGTPDKFMNSKWTTEDYEDSDGDGEWDTPTGTKKTFCVDIEAAVQVAERSTREAPVVIVASEYRNPDQPELGHVVTGVALVYEYRISLGDIVVDDCPVGTPHDHATTAMAAGMNQSVEVAEDVATRAELEAADSGARNEEGRIIRFSGVVRNIDSVPHDYTVSFRTVNLDAPTEPMHFTIAPGGFATFEVLGTELVMGRSALAAIAHSDLVHPDDPVVLVAQSAATLLDGDVNLDGVVDSSDLGALLAAWGQAGVGLASDLNNDDIVNSSDLGILLGAWTR